MVYLPIEKLREGMVLARSIPSSNFLLPFATVGYKLTDASLEKMQERGIQGAYIENPLTDGIEPENFVEPELKHQMLSVIKKNFDKNLKHTTFCATSSEVREISNLAESVVLNVLEKDKLLFQMIDIRDYDNYTYSHSLYVGILSVLLGARIGLPVNKLNELAASGLLHDLGKTDVPLDIINKPGALTDEELSVVKQHPALSAQKLMNSHMFSLPVVNGVKSHHEKYDGTGYPEGLSRDDIPLYGRILAIADVYDALSSSRPYRKAWPPNQIFNYLMGCSNSHFDPELLTQFLQCVAAYPVGSMVTLSDGSTGVVKDNTPGFALRPVIRLLSPYERAGQEIDLATECMNLTIIDKEQNL